MLGDEQGWQAMLRWDAARNATTGQRDAANEQARLSYFLNHYPPVSMPMPVTRVQTGHPAPFDSCLVQIPVKGQPLYQVLDKRQDDETQRTLGTALGQFVAWLNAVPLDLHVVPSTDGLSRDLEQRQAECLEKLRRHGLTANAADNLLKELFELWRTPPKLVNCHNDVYPHHVLVQANLSLGVIDWDDASANEPIRDFAMWYEPFDGGFVFKDAYPVAWQAACVAYRADFPTAHEERRLILYALAGVFAYDNDPEGVHVADWLARYG